MVGANLDKVWSKVAEGKKERPTVGKTTGLPEALFWRSRTSRTLLGVAQNCGGLGARDSTSVVH